MSKLLSTLIGATLTALALTASAQNTASSVPATPAVQGANPAATAAGDKKHAVKAKHQKQKKAKAKAHVKK